MVERPGFVRSLFAGRLAPDSVLPFPAPDAETRETTDEVVAMVSAWADDAIDPAAIDRAKEIPAAVIDGLRELGLFGLTIPEEYGGTGFRQHTYVRVMDAVAHRCASTVTVLGGHLGLGTKALLLYGTDEQKRTWLPRMASGELIGAFALTEAGAGSDAAGLRTLADPRPYGSWVLNGRKVWITNGGFAGFFVVFARTPDPARPDAPAAERPISCFLVLAEDAGLTVGAPEDKMGLRGSSTTEVGLEDVVVPADRLIGPPGSGFKVAMNVLNGGRHGLAACCIGQARLARALAVEHAGQREQFGRPIGSFGMVQELLAGIEADLYAMQAGTWLTAGLVDRGDRDTLLEAACCKTFATERLWRIANDALQVTGGTGFMREYPYERIVRDARINMIFEGTNQILRWMLSIQGLRGLSPDAIGSAPGRMAGVHPELAEEGAGLEALAAEFAGESRTLLAEHGAHLREAQLPIRRVSDMAVSLFQQAAVLSRASAALASDGDDAGREAALARLACRRLRGDFLRARTEGELGTDELVSAVAGSLLGREGAGHGAP